jgi:hypothetical protein
MLSAEITRPPKGPSHSVQVPRLDATRAILEPHVHACLVSRRLPVELQRDFQRMIHGEAFELHRDGVQGGRDADDLVRGLRPGPARDFLRGDVERLAALYEALCEGTRPRMGVFVVDSDACAKFHTDHVGLRLIVTYCGPGSEWVAEEGVDRRYLGCELPLAEANARIAFDPGAVRRAGPGDILLLKGDAWPGNAGRGAVHRSPPIQGTGIRRLVLKLDDLDPGC